ncbi:NAD(P)H-dependent flavin oxidoreductase [Geobacillus thermodenitrificans]|jgi:nitronate monooxygenase|uniref:Probable nitronate monooxygenase n=2 Tax=Geobacillus thermodenitrificans TaxID=33940 RepID=A4IP65_GEOTN|nr:nitronate monooxygenase [Geobacillus thermodenitrificans]ABO67119.1 Putative 2-nitropropane dioxygenase [Geobacillus thermodenitrificans NG80-2]ARA96584.1 2-nitropropane dioxygenase [Geobacillus thermodenitrificans]ARA99644.1 2-nitropropane dioxygenase [Geobacillus thermodenitrificans]MED0661901.1 2-nitropropane dioxygenase [Geobacillus thermodenitrificans]MED3718455.1 nitronate monooxygenase [Geobacillus thermodenitrificans]
MFSTLPVPIIQAPMAGGVSTPELAAAVSNAGGLGFLAGGYQTAEMMRTEIHKLRTLTDRPFGVNVFVPGETTVDEETLSRYRAVLATEAERLGATVGEPKWDDDDWEAKLDVLLKERVPVVSFTFGCPETAVITALQKAGAFVIVTVTSVEEAQIAAEAGANALCVQGAEAGGHRASFRNDPEKDEVLTLFPLLADVHASVRLPLVAAGGIMDGYGIAAALQAGASAVQLGTAFLRCPESGAHPLHKQALVDPRFTETAVTRAFTGRPARGLANRFMAEYSDLAPAAYPQVHHMTKPMRAAAAKVGDRERMALWAGEGYRMARELPAGELVRELKRELEEAQGR